MSERKRFNAGAPTSCREAKHSRPLERINPIHWVLVGIGLCLCMYIGPQRRMCMRIVGVLGAEGRGPRCIRKGIAWWRGVEGSKGGQSVVGQKHTHGGEVTTSPAPKQHQKMGHEEVESLLAYLPQSCKSEKRNMSRERERGKVCVCFGVCVGGVGGGFRGASLHGLLR